MSKTKKKECEGKQIDLFYKLLAGGRGNSTGAGGKIIKKPDKTFRKMCLFFPILMKINIVYATILGTSQMVAEELDDALSDKYEFDVQDILQISPAELSGDAFYVFISSTTGHGDMPDSAYDFVAAKKLHCSCLGCSYGFDDLAEETDNSDGFVDLAEEAENLGDLAEEGQED